MMNTIADAAIAHHKSFPTGTMRLTMLLTGMKFEIETGMKLCRGPKCSSRVKKEFGLKGNAQNVYWQYLQLLIDAGVVILKDDEPKEPEAATPAT